MSRIYFHNPDIDDLELRGSERAYIGRLIDDLSLALLAPDMHEEQIKRHLEETCYLHNSPKENFEKNFKIWFRVSDDHFMDPYMDRWEMSLNTAYKFGNDQIKLMCRLHAQCEIHCYIQSNHLAWFSDIVKEGLETGIYRKNQGWEEVMQFSKLYKGNHPVVCSYSVCDQFPNPGVAEYADDKDGDGWYDLPYEKKWGMAITRLISTRRGLQITPDNWQNYYFGENKTVFDLLT